MPMKQSKSLVFATVFLLIGQISLSTPQAQAKARRSGRSGGGGVYLQTPEPRDPGQHNDRGVELGNRGLWPDAIREHKAALEGDPYNKEFVRNLSTAHLRYGDLLASKRDYYGAMQHYRQALTADPANAPADQHLDEVLKRTGKNPLDVKVRMNIAEGMEVASDYENAVVEYRKCVTMQDTGRNRASLAQAFLKAGKPVYAFNEYKIAVNKEWNLSDSDQRKELSNSHVRMGDILKEHAYKAREQKKSDIALKRLLNAGVCYRRAVTILPSNGDAIRGLIEVSREAVSINPNSFDNHLSLGGAYLLGGQFELAQREYTKAYELDPDNIQLAPARKAFYKSMVESPLSVQTPALLQNTIQKIEAGLKKTPKDAFLWYLLGRGQEQLGNNDAALEAYGRAYEINQYIDKGLADGLKRLGSPLQVKSSDQLGIPIEGTQTSKQPKAGGTGTPAGTTTQAPVAPVQPKINPLVYVQAEQQIDSGGTEQAKAALMAIVEKNPTEGQAWFLLGRACEKEKNIEQAAAFYRQAINLKYPGADSALRGIDILRVQPLLDQVEKALQENDPIRAASTIREAINMAPNLALVHRKYSDVLRKLGDTKEADKEAAKAQDLEKNAK